MNCGLREKTRMKETDLCLGIFVSRGFQWYGWHAASSRCKTSPPVDAAVQYTIC